MPKPLWVALPLLLAAALVVLQSLRRRPPSRLALNVWSSVLLLAYLLTTAGLGIFWVANQQLPVFDWHYLFGYGTVLLASLHLALNFRVVWHYLARPRKVSPTEHNTTAPGRRRMLDALGWLLAGGMGFALGMRHGRSELRVESPASGADGALPVSAGQARALVERFHAFSSHSRAGVLLRAPGVEWGDPPAAFKHDPDGPTVTLPAPRSGPRIGFDAAGLGSVLWHTTGVTDSRGGLSLRASPSSGGLFSTELYVAVRAVPGLPPGWWHYDPQRHALEQLPGAIAETGAFGSDPGLRDAAALVLATAVFRRTGHKYRDRTYRYVLADLGHALENLRVATAAAGLQARFVSAFDESLIAAALGVDEHEEGVLALAILQTAGQPQAATPFPSAPSTCCWRPPPLPAANGSPPGVTAAVHTATSLRAATSSMAAHVARAAPEDELPPAALVLPRTRAMPGRVLDIIKTRRSVRRFAGTPLALDTLAGVLEGMTTRTGPLLSSAVRVNVVIHAVDGVPAGVFRHEPRQHALVPRRVPAGGRAATRAAALDQDVIGDAAAVFVLSIDRTVFAADPLGPARGYRHAFLEAGLIGERIYLEAGARGLGACAVGAFYDAEAAALVGIDPSLEWVVHFAALGVPGG